MIQIQESSVYTNSMIKDYGTHKKLIVFKNNVRKQGFEECEFSSNSSIDIEDIELNCEFPNDLDVCESEKNEQIERANHERSIRRSKQKIRAIAHLNEWDYFFTLTFDKDKVKDRYDYDYLLKITLEYFKNQSKKYGCKYLLVAEPHKDGALHFHGLLCDCNCELKLTDTNLKDKKGRNIYKLTSWDRYKGFSNLTKIDSHVKVANYISKYISKENSRLLKKYYYCSNGLKNKPSVTYCDGISVDSLIEVYGDNVIENAYCYMVTL